MQLETCARELVIGAVHVKRGDEQAYVGVPWPTTTHHHLHYTVVSRAGVVHGPNYTPGKWFRARRGPPDRPLSQCISQLPCTPPVSPGDRACKPPPSFFDPCLCLLYVEVEVDRPGRLLLRNCRRGSVEKAGEGEIGGWWKMLVGLRRPFTLCLNLHYNVKNW